MVKPGLTSLDLIAPIREATGKLVGAYQVSGEYAGLCALGRDGLADFDAALLETWHVFRRAGAAYIITYGARPRPRLWECRCDRSRAVVRPRVEGRAGRRAESGSRVPLGRRHADLHAACRGAQARSTSPAGRSSISARASDRCCSDIAIPTCAPSWPRRSSDGWTYGCCEPYSLALAEWITAQRAVGRADSLRLIGHRGGDVGIARRARRDRAVAHPEVRRVLSRSCRFDAGPGRQRPRRPGGGVECRCVRRCRERDARGSAGR